VIDEGAAPLASERVRATAVKAAHHEMMPVRIQRRRRRSRAFVALDKERRSVASRQAR